MVKYSYNVMVAGDTIGEAMFNDVTASQGRVTDVGLFPVIGCNYLIFANAVDGTTTYYARNGITGKVDFSDETYANVLASVIAALPSGNGLVVDNSEGKFLYLYYQSGVLFSSLDWEVGFALEGP